MCRTKQKSVRRGFALAAFAALTLALQAVSAQAQWATGPNGNDINNTNKGNVGVGTAAPASKLHVVDSDTTPDNELFVETTTGTYGPTLRLRHSITGQTADYLITATGASNAGGAGAFRIYDYVANATRFFIAPNSGNVGLGTTTPSTRLTVDANSPATTGIRVLNSAGNSYFAGVEYMDAAGTVQAFAGLQPSSGQYRINNIAPNGYLDFLINHSSKMTIANSGNVGIGTTAPGRKLEVLAPDGEAARLYRNGNGTGWGVNMVFALNNSNNARTDYAGVHGVVGNPTAGVEAGALVFSTATSGSLSEKMRVDSGGNVGIGTTAPASKLHVVGDITVTGNINAKYQDVAEWVQTREKLSAGTVVVLDTKVSNHVLASTSAYDTRVAGVVSARPGIALGEAGEGKALVATTGRVKVRVDATAAPVQIGDLLVTSDVPGVAMKSQPITVGGRQIHAPGTIIGKALEPLDKGTGEILVLLSLQ